MLFRSCPIYRAIQDGYEFAVHLRRTTTNYIIHTSEITQIHNITAVHVRRPSFFNLPTILLRSVFSSLIFSSPGGVVSSISSLILVAIPSGSFESMPPRSFSLKVLSEGKYSCDVKVDANPSNPAQYPGDYKGHASFSAVSKSFVNLKIDMERIIHLTKPEDNGIPMLGWGSVCFNNILFESPVQISWEPIEKDVYYTYTVNRTECDPFSQKELLAGDTITYTDISLRLPPNEEKEFYTLQITARKNGRQIGSLMTHGENGWGWDYRFRVGKQPEKFIEPFKL